jgi:hypothetical protein
MADDTMFESDRLRVTVDHSTGLFAATLLGKDRQPMKIRVLDADETLKFVELLREQTESAVSAGFPFVEVGRLLFPDDL